MCKPLDPHTLSLLCYEAQALHAMAVRYSHRAPSAALPLRPTARNPNGSCFRSSASTLAPGAFHDPFATLAGPSCPPTDEVVRNALLESFLVHYRILAEFLCKKKRGWPDQILAADFLGKAPVADNHAINTRRDDCDKWLSHLSTCRMPNKKPDWNIPAMYSDIMAELHTLIKVCGYDHNNPEATQCYQDLNRLPAAVTYPA